MTVRKAVLADAAQIRTIWQDNLAEMRSYWPDGAANVPDFTLAQLQKYVQADIIDIRASDVAGAINAFLVTSTGPQRQEVLMFLIRGGVTLAQRRALLKADGIALLTDWANRALAQGVTDIVAYYPTGGHVTMLNALAQMSAANGVAATPERSGFLAYHVTPQQLLVGLAAVT